MIKITSNINLIMKKRSTSKVAGHLVSTINLTTKYCHSLDTLYLLVNFGLMDNPISNYREYKTNIKIT